MAIKPAKASFSLSNVTQESMVPVSAVSLSTSKIELTEEDQETLDNINASNKFEILNKQSLNPLKPIVVGNTEFVPVATGNTSPDATGLKAQFGEGNVLSVNNITKLFEIQRQIRNANLANSEKLLKIAKGYDNSLILEEVRKKMKEVFDDIVEEDINKTIENFIKVVGQNLTLSRQAKSGEKQASTFRSSIVTKSPKLKKVNTDNKNDPYYKTLIEYAAYEIILYEAIEFLSGILRFKNAAEKSWSILESTSFTAIKDMSFDSLGTAASNFIDSSNLSGIGAHNMSNPGNERFSDVIGVNTSASSTDTALVMQTIVSAYDEILLKKGYHDDMLNFEKINIKSKPKIQTSDPVRDALMTLQKSWLVGLYDETLDYNIGNARTNDTRSPYQTRNNPKNAIDDNNNEGTGLDSVEGFLGESKINKIMSNFPREMGDSEVYGELLSACMFNDAFDIAQFQTTSTAPALYYLDNSRLAAGDINQFFKSILGDDLANTMRPDDGQYGVSDVDYDPLDSNPLAGSLGKYLSSKQSADNDFRYLPFESTQNYAGATKYLTGPEYFIDVALQRGDRSFADFTKFTTNYKMFSKYYITDVEKRTKMFEVEESFISLCTMIGEDLETEAASFDKDLPRFAMLVKNAKTRKGMAKAFKSAYFGNMILGQSDDTADSKKDAGDPFIERTDTITKRQARQRIVRYKANKILRDFIVNTLNVPSSKLREINDNDFRNLGGEKYTSIKEKEYTKKDKNFDKINGTKIINEGTQEPLSNKKEYKIHKQSGKNYKGSDDHLNKEQYQLDAGLRFGRTSLKGFLSNKHFENTIFEGSSTARTTFNQNRPGLRKGGDLIDDDIMKELPRKIRSQGGIYSLSEHHRAFILFSFVAKILQLSLTIKASSSEGAKKKKGKSKSDNAYIKLIGNKDEFLGVKQAFLDIGDNNLFVSSYKSKSASFRAAYSNTTTSLREVLESIRRRVQKISQLVLTPAVHSMMLDNQRKKIVQYMSAGDGSKRSQAAIDLLENSKIRAFKNSLSLISEESVSEMFNSYIHTFVPKKSSIFTFEDVTSPKQVKLMIKILSNPGYGFLSSEKRGNPVVSHVGVTNSMLATMRYEAYRETGNVSFLESKRFCVNIFKRNEIDSQEVVYPKTFLFDSKYQIHDHDQLGDSLNHIANYSDTWTFDNIVDNIEFTSWSDDVEGQENEDPFNNLKEAYRPKRTLGSKMINQNNISKDLLINHINDYAIKIYYRYALGLELETYSFTLNSRSIDYSNPAGGFGSASSEMLQNYNDLINQITNAYPAANIDPILAAELYRSIKTISATPIYALSEKTKRVLLPKKFDRVLSIPFNDKDFVLYTPAFDKEFEEIFKTTPNFSYTSRIARPDLKYGGQQNSQTYIASNPLRKTVEEKYKDNCKEDFPEIFSTYVTITILPEGTN